MGRGIGTEVEVEAEAEAEAEGATEIEMEAEMKAGTEAETGRTGEGTKGAGGACTGSGTVSVPVCRVFLTRVVHRVPPTPAPPLSPLLCDGDASYWSPDPVALSTAFPNAPTDAL